MTKEGQLLRARAESWLKKLKETLPADDQQPIRLTTTHAIARVAIPVLLTVEFVELKLMRPDSAYGAILSDETDIALVLDNAPRKGVTAVEIGKGKFQPFLSQKNARESPIFLPEDQMEVLTLQQRW